MDDNQLQESIAALKQNINQARIVAAESTTDPEILRELALFSDEQTRKAVVSNANTSPEVLVQLGEQFPSQFLDNPVFPLLLLENPNFIQELPLFTLRSILTQENCPEYILEQAADKADLEVQLALANNIKTSREILNRLNQSQYSEVVEAVNLHVNFVGELSEGVEEKIKEVVLQSINSSHRVNYSTLVVLAQICPIPEFIIEHWVKESMYTDLCRELADSPATPPLVLKHLGNHSNAYIRGKVAQNINTPVETLRELAHQEMGDIKILVTCNPNTPSDILEYLSKDENERVRLNVAKNPNTSLTVLKKLTKDSNQQIVQTAQRIISERKGEYSLVPPYDPRIPLDLLRFFQAIEKYTDVQAWESRIPPQAVAKHQNTPSELLIKLSQSDDEIIRQNVAANPNTPVSVLEKLANDNYYKVRLKVAQNPNTPINILFKKLARDTKVISAIASQISPHQQSTSIYKAKSIIDIIAEYSNSPVEIIVQVIALRGGPLARLFLASRSDLPTDLLAQLAEKNELKLRKAIARNPNTPTDILEKLMNDKSVEVREQVFQNPSLSKEIVIRILCSEHASYYLKLNPDCLSRYPDIKASLINYYANLKSPVLNILL